MLLLKVFIVKEKKLSFFVLINRFENFCFNFNHILGNVILQLMYRYVNRCNELKLLLSVFKFLFNHLNRNRLKVDLNVFWVMNQLFSEYRFCHWEQLIVVFYKGKLFSFTCNAVVTWLGLKNNMTWISSWDLSSDQWFTLFHCRT